jgi:hypothetical protein
MHNPTLPRSALLAVAALAAAALAACAPAQALTPPTGEPLYPDLGVAPIAHLAIGVATDGTRLLFFTATLVNVGEGPLLISAERTRGGWRVTQHVRYSETGRADIDVPATLVYGGDGHGHWHIEQAARYVLRRLDAAEEEPRHDAKAGFCFFDNLVYRERAETPAEPVHHSRHCGTSERHRSIAMGLSPGWGDQYHWFLPGQHIDVTGMPDGRYRLEVSVDPAGWFAESSSDNNTAWVEFEIRTRPEDRLPAVLVIETGPGA